MAIIDNIVSYWKFDANSGTQSDEEGVNDMTVNGATFTGSGFLNSAYSYVTNDYMSKSSPTGLSGLSAFTYSGWLKLGSLPTLGYLTCYGDPDGFNDASWFLRQQSSQLYVGLYADAGTSVLIRTAASTLSAGPWFHIAFVWEASTTLKIYINGTDTGYTYAVGSGIPSDMESTPSDNTLRHGSDDATWFLDGVLDEVGVWDRALTSGEITSLYNGGAGFAYPFVSAGYGNDVLGVASASIGKVNGVATGDISKVNNV